MTLGRSTVLTLAAATIALAAPAAASATPTWLAPVTVSDPADNAFGAPQVAVNAQGDATAVWAYQVGSGGQLQGGARPPGGPWSAPIPVSGNGPAVSDPRVVTDEQGNATAVWSANDGRVKAATRPLGGVWSAPVNVNTGVTIPHPPQVGIDGQGNVTAVWVQDPANPLVVQSATLPPGGTWSAPVNVSSVTSLGMDDLQLAVDAHGDATAVWWQSNGSNQIIRSAARTGGTWSTPVTLSAAGENAFVPQVAMDAQGDATAVWDRFDGSTTIVQAATRTAGTWSTPVNLSALGSYGDSPQVAMDGQGDATAIWAASADGVLYTTQSAARATGGAWSAAVDLGVTDTSSGSPHLAVDAQGDATAVWPHANRANTLVRAAWRALGGVWSTPVDVSAAGQNVHAPQVAVDGQGDATAIWSADGTSTTLVKSAVLDAAGPVLGSLQIPATGTVGTSLAFSVSPSDVWSALGATTWDFGDGGAATGTGVTHAYAAAGTYTVTVTSADVWGNTTAQMGSVTVAAAPTPPPTPPTPPVSPLTLTGVSASPLCLGAGPGAGPDVKISYTLSDAAQVTYTLQRRTAPGLTTPRTCPSPLAPSTKTVTYTTVGSPTGIASGAGPGYATVQQNGSVTRSASSTRGRHPLVRTARAPAGRSRVSLLRTLRAAGPLAPGRYRVLIQAVRDDGASSQQSTVWFWVLRPPKR